ncbi:MAG: 30S ribosomal protein S3 [Candidatus Thorarchaeota archaeon]|nr:30S ribosomal protein S3 [Candidatus Thorarchaeota archaeon]
MSAVKYFIEQNARRLRIDEFLAMELNSAGYGGVEIRKMPTRTEVIIHASRPGVVIGRRGSKIRELTDILDHDFGIRNVQVEVAEIENPWLSAQVMASRLARQLERGVRFRRMAYWILRRVMRAGALGCEIIVKGKLSSRRARYQKFRQATIAKTGRPAEVFVDEADDIAVLKPGVIGVKVRIMKPDAKLPGVITVKKPKVKKVKERELIKAPEEPTEEEVTEAEAIEEELEGITDIDELRELEELDALDLVEDTPTEPTSSEPVTDTDSTQPAEEPSTEKTAEAEKPVEEGPTDVDLSELDALDKIEGDE